jgi:hypothetical protein
MLCDGRIDLGPGFIRLILQVLYPYLCQHSSPGDVISGPNIASAAIGGLDLFNSGNVTGRPESKINLSIRNEGCGVSQAFGRLVESHVGKTDSDGELRGHSGFMVAAAEDDCRQESNRQSCCRRAA